MDETGRWRLSPAYDLTYAPRPDGERWTTVAGVGSTIHRADLLRLAAETGIATRHARRIVDDVVDAALQAHDVLKSCGCDHPVSHAAADAVFAATERLR